MRRATPRRSAPCATAWIQPTRASQPAGPAPPRTTSWPGRPRPPPAGGWSRRTALSRRTTSARTRAEYDRRSAVSVPSSPTPRRSACGQAVAEAGQQVVVDALADPGGQDAVGEVVALVAVRVGEHRDQLGGHLVQRRLARHRQPPSTTDSQNAVPTGPSWHRRPAVRSPERRCGRDPAPGGDRRRGLRSPGAVPDRPRARATPTSTTTTWSGCTLLLADWQMLADLSFADLVLWLPDRDGHAASGAGGQMRPTTGPTAYVGRHGRHLRPARAPAAARRGARRGRGSSARATRSGATTCRCASRRSRYAAGGRVIARDRAQHQPARRPDAEPAGADLPADRRRPAPDDRRRALPDARAERSGHADPPRVGDGCPARRRRRAWCVYASPNALSVYRRLGLCRRPGRAPSWAT